MGNNCCGSRKKDIETLFTDREKLHLESLFDNLTDPKRTQGKHRFNTSTLGILFPENPNMALFVYNIILHVSKTERHIDYQNFESALEILIKDPVKIRHKEFEDKEKIDIIALAFMNNFKLSQDELRNKDISYLQAVDFIQNLLKIFHYESQSAKSVDESVAKGIVDGAFRKDEEKVTWWTFLHYIKENLIYVNRCLELYFTAKFLDQKVNLKIPDLNKASFLLNRDLIGLLYLSNIYMQSTPNLEFVYSSRNKGLFYSQIAKALENYQSSTYIFLKVEPFGETESPTKITPHPRSNFIIGGFSRLPWKDTGEYAGDNDCHIFSLSPKFQNFYALTKSSAHPNYTYLKSTFGYNQGIGFGGGKNGDFRIWIDGQDMNQSYVQTEDQTYSPGSLLGPGYSRMKIIEVEIWGLPIDYHNKQYMDSLLNASALNRRSTAVPYGTVENVAMSTMFNKNGSILAYNQSKIAEVIHQNDQLKKSLNLFESQLALNTPQKERIITLNPVEFHNNQENAKKSSRSPNASQDSFYKENLIMTAETMDSIEGKFAETKLSPKILKYPESYGYSNPFKSPLSPKKI